MSVKHENPYREGSQYHKVFGFIKTKQVVTRAEVLAKAIEFGMSEEAANATVTVLLSPRKESKRGDCRGNISAQGHLYFVERLPRRIVNGEKEPMKFRLRWRTTELEPRCRVYKVVSEKSATKAAVTATAPESVKA